MDLCSDADKLVIDESAVTSEEEGYGEEPRVGPPGSTPHPTGSTTTLTPEASSTTTETLVTGFDDVAGTPRPAPRARNRDPRPVPARRTIYPTSSFGTWSSSASVNEVALRPEASAATTNEVEIAYEVIDLTKPVAEYRAEVSPTDLRVKLTKVVPKDTSEEARTPLLSGRGQLLHQNLVDQQGYQVLPGFRFSRPVPGYSRLPETSSPNTTSGSKGTTSASFEYSTPPALPSRFSEPRPTYAEILSTSGFGSLSSSSSPSGGNVSRTSTSDGSVGCLQVFRNCSKKQTGRKNKGKSQRRKSDAIRREAQATFTPSEEERYGWESTRFAPYSFLQDRNHPRFSVIKRELAIGYNFFPTQSNLGPPILKQAGNLIDLARAPIANWALGLLPQDDFESSILVRVLISYIVYNNVSMHIHLAT